MFPWQTTNWKKLTDSCQSNRLAHALLFHGASGTGKNSFAIEFAHWLLCEQPGETSACGTCKTCQLVAADTHPDLVFVKPEEEGKAIKVDQVRELIDKVAYTSHAKGYRVIIISPADALNINASNSLLKTLEEPPENTVLIMVTDKPSRLMPTIRSRTQMLRFELPDRQQGLAWLAENNVEQAELSLNLAAGAPLAAKKITDNDGLQIRDKLFQNWLDLASGKADALESAAMWVKEGLKVIHNLPLNWVSSWMLDMLRSSQGGNIETMVNTDYAHDLQKLAGQVDLKSLYGLQDRLNDTIRLAETPANQLMLVEGLLLHWAGLKRS